MIADMHSVAAVMSSNGETNVVLRGVTHGAVDFLIKPVRVEELRNVWQHVVRRKRDQVRLGSLFNMPTCIRRVQVSRPTLCTVAEQELLVAVQAKDSREISDEEGTDDGKPRDKKRKEVWLMPISLHMLLAENMRHVDCDSLLGWFQCGAEERQR